jgi:TetR/AcrR family transcriptional regulator
MKYNVIEDPEAKIIAAANKVFLKYGVEAATMMQIADEAGLSRTSLHYYYRNKAHLFAAVFEAIEAKMIPALTFVEEYIDLITQYPMIPGFMSSEIQRNPEWLTDLFQRKNLNFDALRMSLASEAAEGKIRPICVEDLIANTFGMCVFPVLSKPLFMAFVYEGKEACFNAFMQERKKVIVDVLQAWLQPVFKEGQTT